MIDAQIGYKFKESVLEVEGDGQELAADIINIMATIYDHLLHTCPCCPPVFKDVFLESNILKEMFDRVDKDFKEELEEAGYESYDEFLEDLEADLQSEFEDFEEFEESTRPNNIVSFCNNKNKNDMKLFGLDEYKNNKE